MRIKVIWTAVASFEIDGATHPPGDYWGESISPPGVATKESGPIPTTEYLTLPDGTKVDVTALVERHVLIRAML
jgi:hypothetical protein